MRVVIDIVKPNEQRYPTVGDWIHDKERDTLVIRVSHMYHWQQEMCVAIHEFAEAILCIDRGITQHDVDQFDEAFESNRQLGDTSEPGDHPLAPYNREHCYATSVERMLCAAFGLSWAEYEDAVEEAYNGTKGSISNSQTNPGDDQRS